MNSWYTVRVKYTKQLDDGRLSKVNEPYLVDAVSFTDAEAVIYEELASTIRGEFIIASIAKVEFADIFSYDDCDDYYKCKIGYTSVDADTNRETKITSDFLVMANSVKEATIKLNNDLEGMMVDYEIKTVGITPIVDIFFAKKK